MLHYAIIGLEKNSFFCIFFEWPLKTGFTVYIIQLSLMGIQFEKLKKKSDRPTHTGKTDWVRGNKNIFKVGLVAPNFFPHEILQMNSGK